MSDLKVCRICLRKGVKIYNYGSFHLKQYYEEIMCKKVSNKDLLPKYFCYECAAILYKFHKFREKCWMGEKTLQELLWSGSITLSSLSQIDRQEKRLQSPIDFIKVNKRVRTCIVKSKTLSQSPLKINEIPETEECELHYDSDNSLDNKKKSEIQNEMINEIPQSKDEKTNDDVEISKDENPVLDLEEDRMFSDAESLLEDTDDDDDKPDIKEEITIEENFNVYTEKARSDDEIVLTKNHKEKKTNVDVEISKEEKPVPDLVEDRMFRDAESCLEDTNSDLDKPAIKEVITIEENFNVNTEQAQSEAETVLIKNQKEKKQKKTETNKSVVDKKAKKFEVNNENKGFLDPKHWLKIILTEEEAIQEFRARAQDRKYVSAAYKCTDCYRGFSKEDMLNRHIKIGHSESRGPEVCRFCNTRFKSKCYLTSHITQHYNKYKCLRCDLMCPLKTTALLHDQYHNGVISTCMHCGLEFRHLSTYYTHLRTHRSEHVCTLCGASFVSTVGLQIHKKTMHINTVVNPEEEVNTYCERCDIKFETRKAYEEHTFHSAKHAEGIENLISENPAPSIPERKKKLSKRPRKIAPCNICNRKFSSQKAYLQHHWAEHKDTPLPSKEEQRQICEICGISLKAGSVASHLNTHTRERMYTCPTCRMQFNSKTSMMRHQLTHTGEKPYECPKCEKRFPQKGSMQAHYRHVHLKEPYRKRNRRKKIDELSKDEYGHGDSDDNVTLDHFFARKKRKN